MIWAMIFATPVFIAIVGWYLTWVERDLEWWDEVRYGQKKTDRWIEIRHD